MHDALKVGELRSSLVQGYPAGNIVILLMLKPHMLCSEKDN